MAIERPLSILQTVTQTKKPVPLSTCSKAFVCTGILKNAERSRVLQTMYVCNQDEG